MKLKGLRKIAVFSLAAGMAVTALSACSSGGQAQSDGQKVIKIGVFQPLSGENGGGGLQETMGVRYANKVYPTVNIGGEEYKVELVEVDNKSDKTEAVNAAQKLVSEKVSVVLGS